METPASVILVLLGIIVFQRAVEGTLPQWLRAKFLNSAERYGAPTDSSSSAPNSSSSSAGGAELVPIASGLWTFPVPGAAIGSRGWGEQVHPIYGDRRMHHGVDIGAPHGADVLAARPGVVTYVGPSGGYGLRVDVDHGDGLVTRYAHLSAIDVVLGQVVNAAQRLGLVGSTGTATGPHLHFELRRGGASIDPAPLFTAAAYGVTA